MLVRGTSKAPGKHVCPSGRILRPRRRLTSIYSSSSTRFDSSSPQHCVIRTTCRDVFDSEVSAHLNRETPSEVDCVISGHTSRCTKASLAIALVLVGFASYLVSCLFFNQSYADKGCYSSICFHYYRVYHQTRGPSMTIPPLFRKYHIPQLQMLQSKVLL